MDNRVANDRPVPDIHVTSAIEEWAGADDVLIVPEFHPDPNKTDAQLYCVEVTSHEGEQSLRQRFVVKVVSAETAARLAAGHRRAERSHPAFASRHIVEHRGLYRVDDARRLLIQQVANGGDEVVSLAASGDSERLVALPLIADALVNVWNAADPARHGSGLPTRTTSVGEFVRQEVAHLATTESVLVAAAELGVPDDAGATLVLDGADRPNPLDLLIRTESPLSQRRVVHLVGHTHGDLNGGNVLIPFETGKPRYGAFLLVDLGGYQHDGPLTRDLTFALLGTLLRTVAPPPFPGEPAEVLPRDQAEALRRLMINPETAPSDRVLPGLTQLVRQVYQTGLTHAEQAGLRPAWRQQWLLTLVGQALVHLTFDDIGEAGRRWCLRLAAESLEAYVRLVSGKDTPELPQVASSTLPAGQGGSDASSRRLDLRWPTQWSPDQQRDFHHREAGGSTSQVHEHACAGRGDAAARRPANHVATAAPVPTQHNRAPRPRERRQDDSDDTAPTRPDRVCLPIISLPFVTAALLSVGLVGGAAYFGLSDRRKDHGAAPTQTITPGSTRGESPATTRDHGDRGPTLPHSLDEFAEAVADLVEDPPLGRYACTRYEVRSPEGGPGRSAQLRHHRQELWFTDDRAGRKVVTDLDATGPNRKTSTPYLPGEMDEVRPVPEDDLDALRQQLLWEWGKQPPELRTTSGMVRLVARILLHNPLVPAQHAVLLAELAKMPGIEFAGSYRDDDGEPGVSFQAEDQDGRRDTLLFDRSGRLLRHDLTQGDVLLSQHLLLATGRTDTMDTPCR
ncbi:hypothetical protein [Micromonospora craniellae]|uniref:Uncharacterized protein n=1 Tax=Micromonospora craniellae TaxID=2294034 RepID=A0A372FY14_9ACTN|nr:hypothetical protein [Micromonospora craniellae]QOC93304.1 hypothetical protein ID554_06370 [Micromonospora craniellae]RFS45359.1 hypothetical protein D0Q02_17000 [Micromonospora craniellae]